MRAAVLALLSLWLASPAAASDCCSGPTVCDSTCNTPVWQLGTGYYQNGDDRLQGGLYGEGSNTIPGTHMARIVAAANNIYKRDADGARDETNGKIGVLFIGNSNHEMFADTLQARIAADGTKAGAFITPNGCGSGRTLERIRLAANGYWGAFPASSIAYPDSACDSTGLDPDQVQVVIMQNTAIDSTSFGAGEMADSCSMWVQGIAVIVKSEYPNCQLFYFDGIQYTGQDVEGAPEAPEPIMGYVQSFVPGLAMRGQMASEWCTYDNAPVIVPGCSPWRDGTATGATAQGGLTWGVDDFGADGIHPSAAGMTKFANHFMAWANSDETWQLWYHRKTFNLLAGNDTAPMGRSGSRGMQ